MEAGSLPYDDVDVVLAFDIAIPASIARARRDILFVAAPPEPGMPYFKSLMKKMDYGKGYKYAHDYEGSYVPRAYLPEGRVYYTPTESGFERRVKERLDYWRQMFERERSQEPEATN